MGGGFARRATTMLTPNRIPLPSRPARFRVVAVAVGGASEKDDACERAPRGLRADFARIVARLCRRPLRNYSSRTFER